MRKAWLVSYDISNPRRWRKIYRTMRGYGDHLQLSVFRCLLSRREKMELQAKLEEVMSMTEDNVLFVDMGPASGRGGKAMQSLGKPLPEMDTAAKIL